MKYLQTLLLTFLLFMLATPAWSCRMVITDEQAKKTADNAYFIGLVRGDYLQQYPDGVLKEVGMRPILSYKADPSIDFSKLIVISKDTPRWTSCDADVPERHEFMEVLIIKVDGKLEISPMGLLQTDISNEIIDQLRSQAQYVGKD